MALGLPSILINLINVWRARMSWVTAETAMRRLRIRRQTLYAYVSRGRLEARPDPVDPRRSLYNAEQVEQLARRKSGPRKAADIASATIAWGEPVLASALTTVERGRLWYRGEDAVRLAERATLEDMATLFWGSEYSPPANAPAVARGTMLQRIYSSLANLASSSTFSRGRSLAALVSDSALVLEAMANAAIGIATSEPIHLRLSKAWNLNNRAAHIVRRALVLLVDHELNASTFAARVAASTGTSLAASALSGFAALTGPLHGSSVYGVLEFIEECERDGANTAVRRRLLEGRNLPGFGHMLYPQGDVRAQCLFEALPASKSLENIRAHVESETGERPNVDFAIASFTRAYGVPAEGAFAIFAVGRCVGWLAHAMEQVQSGSLIRPRARYVGVAPQ